MTEAIRHLAASTAARPRVASPPTPRPDDVPTLAIGGDIGMLMAKLQFEDRASREQASLGQAGSHAATRDAEIRHAEVAQNEAKEAKESAEKWGTWIEVAQVTATVVAAVAAVASVVATAGTSTPAIVALVGVALSSSSPLVARAGGEDAGKVAIWGGAALSLGTGVAQIGSAAASEGATIAAQTGAQAVSETAANAGSTVAASLGQRLAGWVATGARVLEGSARGAQGFAAIKKGGAEGDAVHDEAEGVGARASAKQAQADIDDVVEKMRATESSVRRAIQVVMSIESEVQNTRSMIISRIGRSVTA